MEDDLNFLNMKEDLNIFFKWKTTSFFKLKTTPTICFFLKMQDNLYILVNGRQPPILAGNLTNTTTTNKWSQFNGKANHYSGGGGVFMK